MDDFSHNVLSRNDIVRAAKAGRLDLCSSIGSSNDKVREAICEAIQEGHVSVVEYLLTRIDYAGLEINDYDLSKSVTVSIQNKNYKTIEIISKSKLIDFVTFRHMMTELVNENFMDIVKRFWLNDERLETMYAYSSVELFSSVKFYNNRILDDDYRKVPLLSHLLEFAPNLEMVKVLTSSKRFNKDHCNFAALKAVYDRKYDIFQHLREYIDLRMFDDSLVPAAIAVNNIELVKYLVQGGCKVYVSDVSHCDDKEEICSYILENGLVGRRDWQSLKDGFIHRWYRSDEPGRLHTMKLILSHRFTELDDLREDLRTRLRLGMLQDKIKDRTSFPEWDLVFEFMDPDYFILSMRPFENLFIYVWEKYPVLQTVENMNDVMYDCDSSKVVEMILRDNRFDLSKKPINLYHLIDPKRYDIFYVLCKDPRFVLTDSLVSTGLYLCFHEDHCFRLREKRKDFQKLFLKKTQLRDRHQDLWTEIENEERESVQRGVHLFNNLKSLHIEFTLKVLKYQEEVYRNSSIIGPDADVFAHYTRLLMESLGRR